MPALRKGDYAHGIDRAVFHALTDPPEIDEWAPLDYCPTVAERVAEQRTVAVQVAPGFVVTRNLTTITLKSHNNRKATK